MLRSKSQTKMSSASAKYFTPPQPASSYLQKPYSQLRRVHENSWLLPNRLIRASLGGPSTGKNRIKH